MSFSLSYLLVMIATMLFLVSMESPQKKTLLLIGDSVDRFITVDWCEYIYETGHHHVKKGAGSVDIWAVTCPWVKPWVASEITDSFDPYFICSDVEGNSIANVHMLGSAAHGPYFKDNENLVGNPFRTSPERIKKALSLYVASFGWPTTIVYNTILWDVLGIIERTKITSDDIRKNTTIAQKAVSDFQDNYIDRLNELENIIINARNQNSSIDVSIMLRTAAWVPVGGDLLRRANSIVRNIAHNRNYTLYDFDKDVWSSTGVNYSATSERLLFRDWIHPLHYFTLSAGEKMLDKRYSHYIVHRGKSSKSRFPLDYSMRSGSTVSNYSSNLIHSSQFSELTRFINVQGLSFCFVKSNTPLHFEAMEYVFHQRNTSYPPKRYHQPHGAHEEGSNRAFVYFVGAPSCGGGCRRLSMAASAECLHNSDFHEPSTNVVLYVPQEQLRNVFRYLHFSPADVVALTISESEALKQQQYRKINVFPNIFSLSCSRDDSCPYENSAVRNTTECEIVSAQCLQTPSKKIYLATPFAIEGMGIVPFRVTLRPVVTLNACSLLVNSINRGCTLRDADRNTYFESFDITECSSRVCLGSESSNSTGTAEADLRSTGFNTSISKLIRNDANSDVAAVFDDEWVARLPVGDVSVSAALFTNNTVVQRQIRNSKGAAVKGAQQRFYIRLVRTLASLLVCKSAISVNQFASIEFSGGKEVVLEDSDTVILDVIPDCNDV